jgi:4-alpha-glucanotransferase
MPQRLVSAKRSLHAATRRFRARRLTSAFHRFKGRPDCKRALAEFEEEHADWLPDYALFRALHRAHGGVCWTKWGRELVRRAAPALERARRELAPEVEREVFVQREFTRQWASLRAHAGELGVKLLGDVPMFVAHDSADVWTHQSIFRLDERGERVVVAGVPPDYFSADGQLWGNPVYDWGALRATGYAFWIDRMKRTLERFDALRLDHFIGFHRHWEVPARASSARDGRYVEGPGHDLFSTIRDRLGGLPFVAEDLGVVTEGVVELGDAFQLPGMRVLAFAFGSDFRDYQPHRYPRRVVAYTGTHDNDTLVGWLNEPKYSYDKTYSYTPRTPRNTAGRCRAYRSRSCRNCTWARSAARTC